MAIASLQGVSFTDDFIRTLLQNFGQRSIFTLSVPQAQKVLPCIIFIFQFTVELSSYINLSYSLK